MSQEMTYKESGVDIDAAALVVQEIGVLRSRTEWKHQLFQSFGLFAAAFDLSKYQQPVIVTGCDGVGTKIDPLLRHDLLETAGKDLVAMSVNDVLTTGLDPVMFLDYVAIPRMNPEQIRRLIVGISDYCEACGCILAGGETAEMPGIVPENGLELAGFCIGAGEKPDLIDVSCVQPGDALIAIESSGFHANGWSLVRRILEARANEFSESDVVDLLAPTRLYHDVLAEWKNAGVKAKAHAHITGGGIPENLKRVTGNFGAQVNLPKWQNELADRVLHSVSFDEALRTFNMGLGWMTVVSPDEASLAIAAYPAAHLVGEITREGRIEVSRV